MVMYTAPKAIQAFRWQ